VLGAVLLWTCFPTSDFPPNSVARPLFQGPDPRRRRSSRWICGRNCRGRGWWAPVGPVLRAEAAHVSVDNGDEIIVTIREPNLSPVQLLWKGRGHTEQLKFSLSGAMWKETVVQVNWPAGDTRRGLIIVVVALALFLFALYLIVGFIHWAWNG